MRPVGRCCVFSWFDLAGHDEFRRWGELLMVLKITGFVAILAAAAMAQTVTPPPGGGGGGLTGCTVSAGVLTCTGFVASGVDSGSVLLNGLTSGAVNLAVADVAGTAITYVLPSTNGTAGQILTDSGVTACPTLPPGAPPVCHLMQWVSNIAGNAGTATALAATPSLCTAGNAPTGILANGNATGCASIDTGGSTAVGNVTPVTVSANSTSAQVLQQLTIPAGVLNVAASAGGVFTFNGSGIYTAAALQTPTLTWTLNHCTVSGCGSGTVRALATIVTPSVVTATNNTWNIRLVIANTATGATGTLITHGSAVVELTGASDLGTTSSDSNTASSGTIDLTGITYLQLTVTTSTGNAGNSITEDHSSLEPASAQGPPGPAATTNTITATFCQSGVCNNDATTAAKPVILKSGTWTPSACYVVFFTAIPSTTITIDIRKNSTSSVSGTSLLNTSWTFSTATLGVPLAYGGTFTGSAANGDQSAVYMTGTTGQGMTVACQ